MKTRGRMKAFTVNFALKIIMISCYSAIVDDARCLMTFGAWRECCCHYLRLCLVEIFMRTWIFKLSFDHFLRFPL